MRRLRIGLVGAGWMGKTRNSVAHAIEMGPSDPRFAALHPLSGLGLGFTDYKAIEAREMIAAVGEGRKAYPDFAFGYRIQRIIAACQRSHETRSWVKIEN